MSIRYTKQQDGDKIVPVMRGYKFMCCDCRLVHSLDFRIVGKNIEFTIRQDKRATAAARRKICT
jgi:hypothetical protein